MSMQTANAAIASVAATLALCAMTPPAIAAAPAAENAREVRYSDLNLKSEEGRAELSRRIERAARAACGLDTLETGSRIRSQSKEKCYRDALRQIEPQFARIIETGRRGA